MEDVNRRAALALGLTGAFIPSVALLYSASISAEAYGADEGEEVALGVRRVELGKGEAIIPGAQAVTLRDVIFQPQATLPTATMMSDMICHVIKGKLRIVQNGKGFTATKNHVWTRTKGMQEQVTNEGSGVAIMRVTELVPA